MASHISPLFGTHCFFLTNLSYRNQTETPSLASHHLLIIVVVIFIFSVFIFSVFILIFV
ncbi:hypothetical protein HanXRQr2_Chr04g0181321 [Helianthus annuus]|uniref:Uncharacterized protein n=1 Tax=Helianthus annuus TaxID=4232 RepID=A0A251V283_HELAN|nr:hypothetical protein HanXRQr2_Chr04g0181321 [Helianthus annuus]